MGPYLSRPALLVCPALTPAGCSLLGAPRVPGPSSSPRCEPHGGRLPVCSRLHLQGGGVAGLTMMTRSLGLSEGAGRCESFEGCGDSCKRLQGTCGSNGAHCGGGRTPRHSEPADAGSLESGLKATMAQNVDSTATGGPGAPGVHTQC